MGKADAIRVENLQSLPEHSCQAWLEESRSEKSKGRHWPGLGTVDRDAIPFPWL